MEKIYQTLFLEKAFNDQTCATFKLRKFKRYEQNLKEYI